MDFGISTVFNIIGKGISIAKAIWKMIKDLKGLEEKRQELQRQVNVLINILQSIKTVDTLKDPRVSSELHRALGNLDLILEDIGEACASFDFDKAIHALKLFEGKDKKFLERLLNKVKQAKEVAELALTAEGKANVLVVLDQRLKLALSIVQIGFSCTQVRQITHLGIRLTTGFHDLNFVTDNSLDVYTNPYGLKLPKAVTGVKAKVSNQRLIVEWDEAVQSTKYEVRYHETKHLSVICEKPPIALGSQRIKPWQDYAVQVRAVNDVGASSWSFPPVYIRMNEGPPSAPSFLIFETITAHSLNISTDKPPQEQGVTHIIVEKLIKSSGDKVQWEHEEGEVKDCCQHTLKGLNSATEYTVRVRFRNEFDISEPSSPVSMKIENMLSSEPTNLTLIPGNEAFNLKPKIFFKPPFINPGAIKNFEIQIEESTKMSSRKITMMLDGSIEPENDSGIVSHPLDMTVDYSTGLTEYKMEVRAVAKNVVTKTVGRLSAPISSELSKPIGLIPLTLTHDTKPFTLVVSEPEVSTTFTDSGY